MVKKLKLGLAFAYLLSLVVFVFLVLPLMVFGVWWLYSIGLVVAIVGLMWLVRWSVETLDKHFND